MNRTLSVMKTMVGNNIQDTSVSFLGMVGFWIQDRYKEVKRRLNLQQTTTTDYTITLVSGTSDYVLPADFRKEVLVINNTSNLVLKRIDDQGLIRNTYSYFDLIAPIDVVQPVYLQYYCVFDRDVMAQPTSSSVISVRGTDVADSGVVTIRGLNSSGMHDYEEISLNGTSTVAGSISFIKIISVSKSAETFGSTIVTSNSGAVTIAYLSKESLESRVKIIRFISTPTSSDVIRIDYVQEEMPMTLDGDYPIMDCSDVLEAGATADGWRYKRQFSKAQVFEQIFEKRLANLAWDYENQFSQIHLFKPARPNRLTTF